MMEEGRHNYGPAERDYERRAARLAAEMDAEISAGAPMIISDSGAMIPAKLAGRTEGWQGDRSHEEGQSERLLALYRQADEITAAIRQTIRTGEHPDSLISRAVALATAWERIRREIEQ